MASRPRKRKEPHKKNTKRNSPRGAKKEAERSYEKKGARDSGGRKQPVREKGFDCLVMGVPKGKTSRRKKKLPKRDHLKEQETERKRSEGKSST